MARCEPGATSLKIDLARLWRDAQPSAASSAVSAADMQRAATAEAIRCAALWRLHGDEGLSGTLTARISSRSVAKVQRERSLNVFISCSVLQGNVEVRGQNGQA